MRNKRPAMVILAVLAVIALVAAGMSAVQIYRTPAGTGDGEPVAPTTTGVPGPDTEASSPWVPQAVHG